MNKWSMFFIAALFIVEPISQANAFYDSPSAGFILCLVPLFPTFNLRFERQTPNVEGMGIGFSTESMFTNIQIDKTFVSSDSRLNKVGFGAGVGLFNWVQVQRIWSDGDNGYRLKSVLPLQNKGLIGEGFSITPFFEWRERGKRFGVMLGYGFIATGWDDIKSIPELLNP